MLSIAIWKEELPLLNSDGCAVTINGKKTLLCRRGKYLTYDDNRCQIIDEIDDGNGYIHFFAKSHGMENEPHVVLKPSILGDIEVVKS